MVFSSPAPLFATTVLAVPAFSACLSQDAFVPRGILRQYQVAPPHDTPWGIRVPAKTTEPSHGTLVTFSHSGVAFKCSTTPFFCNHPPLHVKLKH